MLLYMNYWFASFLFGGFLIAEDDLYWPLKLFYYILPFSYYMRSSMYQIFVTDTFEPCLNPLEAQTAVCTPSTAGGDVLDVWGRISPLYSSNDQTAQDMLALVAIGCFYKFLYVVGVLYKTTTTTKIHES